MAATKYTFSIYSDFPNHKVATDRLSQEIADSTIVTALDYINTSGDDCDVWFKDALSSGDVTTLDGLVVVHSGEPLPDEATPVKIDGARFDSDGKQVIVPTPAPSGSYTWYTSQGDQITPTIIRGGGTPARIVYDTAETGVKTVEMSFAEAVYVHDGEINWRDITEFNGTDHFSIYVKFGQSDDLTPNPGAGNCNITTPPFIVPALNNDGDYDIDLTTACPIPSSSGPWIVNEKTEAITPYITGQALGKYDQRILLITQYTPDPMYLVRNVALGSPRGIFEIDAYLVEWMSRHWKLGLEVTKVKASATPVEVNAVVMLFRWAATETGEV